jgi:hypothetical protein
MSEGRGGLLSAGGILSIIVGAFELLSGAAVAGLFTMRAWFFASSWFLKFPGFPGNVPDLSLTIVIIIGVVLAVLGIIAIVGGIAAIKRHSFGLSLAGAICALLPINVLGILALIFVSLAKREFE